MRRMATSACAQWLQPTRWLSTEPFSFPKQSSGGGLTGCTLAVFGRGPVGPYAVGDPSKSMFTCPKNTKALTRDGACSQLTLVSDTLLKSLVCQGPRIFSNTSLGMPTSIVRAKLRPDCRERRDGDHSQPDFRVLVDLHSAASTERGIGISTHRQPDLAVRSLGPHEKMNSRREASILMDGS
jgi:hypothetical protein